jgi:hypothetical protein
VRFEDSLKQFNVLNVLDPFDLYNTRIETLKSVNSSLNILHSHLEFQLLAIDAEVEINLERWVKLGMRFFLKATKDALGSAYLGMDVSARKSVH